MKPPNITAAARCAKDVSRKVGVFLKSQLRTPKHINLQTAHDIKLELDNRSQAMIERGLRKSFPHVPFLGEEGEVGDTTGEWRWVVDPIDGTVNFRRGMRIHRFATTPRGCHRSLGGLRFSDRRGVRSVSR